MRLSSTCVNKTWSLAPRTRAFERALKVGLHLAVAALSSGCSLLLDFGKFEATVDCPECDAGASDPPTSDASMAPSAPAGRCAQTPEQTSSTGTSSLLRRRRLAELPADAIHKTQVLVGANFLYHVAYTVEDEHPDVVLRAFALDALNDTNAEADADRPLEPHRTQRISDFLPAPHVVRSAASITLDGAERVVLYVAHGLADLKTADLSRLVFDPDLSQPGALKVLTDPPNYRVSGAEGWVGPAAGVLSDGAPFVAWQGCKSPIIPKTNDLCAEIEGTPGWSAIYTHTGERRLEREFLGTHGLEELLPITGVTPLSGGAKPAVVWGTTNSDTVVSLWMGVPDDDVVQAVRQCHAVEGFALHSLHSTPTYNGISSIVWSKRLANGASSFTEATSVACGKYCTEHIPEGHLSEGTTVSCDGALFSRRVFGNVRSAAHGVYMLDTEQNSEAIIVSAQIHALEDEQARLTVTHTRGSPNPNLSPFLDAPSDEPPLAVGAPAWPELHVQRRLQQRPRYAVVGVSWLESSATRTVAKLQTYDLCLP